VGSRQRGKRQGSHARLHLLYFEHVININEWVLPLEEEAGGLDLHLGH